LKIDASLAGVRLDATLEKTHFHGPGSAGAALAFFRSEVLIGWPK